MKKLVLTAAALFVVAGSASAIATSPIAPQPKAAKKLTVNVGVIPPGCPPGDPRGCGIYD